MRWCKTRKGEEEDIEAHPNTTYIIWSETKSVNSALIGLWLMLRESRELSLLMMPRFPTQSPSHDMLLQLTSSAVRAANPVVNLDICFETHIKNACTNSSSSYKEWKSYH